MLEILNFYGSDIMPQLDNVVNFRLKYFREYPYLYDGKYDEDIEHLIKYAKSCNSLVTITKNEVEVVAIATSLPLKVFSKFKDIDNDKYYYLGEFIITPKYRRTGLAHQIIALHEENARRLGFEYTCLMTVERNNHPLKPNNYVEIDVVCERYEYIKSKITQKMSWKTIQPDGSSKDEEHTMALWTKHIHI